VPSSIFSRACCTPLTRDIPGDRGVFTLAGDLVDLVDVDDAALGLVHIHIRLLQQPQQDVLHVFTDVARFGERGGIRHRKRHIKQFGQGLGQQGLAAAGGADQQDVGFVQPGGGAIDLAIAIALPGQALVVVVDSHGEHFLGLLLAHHLGIEKRFDLQGLGNRGQGGSWLGGFFRRGFAGRIRSGPGTALNLNKFLIKDLVTEIDAFIADVDPGPGDQLAHLLLGLAAERTLQIGVELGHQAEASERRGKLRRKRGGMSIASMQR